MLQSMNCIRTGQLLLDENLQSFVLCSNCHTDFFSLQEFHTHLGKCDGYDKFLKPELKIKYDCSKCTQLVGKSGQTIKEYSIYDFQDVELILPKSSIKEESFMDIINIEEELLDPRWYTDLSNDVSTSKKPQTNKKNLQYDELVEAVTPFVQFKENLKSNNHSSAQINKLAKASSDSKNQIQQISNGNEKLIIHTAKPGVKRKLVLSNEPLKHPSTIAETISPQNYSVQIKKDFVRNPIKRRKIDINAKPVDPVTQSVAEKEVVPTIEKEFKLQNPFAKTSNANGNVVVREKQTAQILNKLQTLGLQIKRTQSNNVIKGSKADSKTLELLQKLQSKGMKVKILRQTPTHAKTSATTTNYSINRPITKTAIIKTSMPNTSARTTTVASTAATTILPLNKDLIIKKVN
uniref:Uncharacterized protein n=1 Tax=Glossina morsitans morsitans TaxID=37546 RepID=A0A1B0G9Z1_GLOMM